MPQRRFLSANRRAILRLAAGFFVVAAPFAVAPCLGQRVQPREILVNDLDVIQAEAEPGSAAKGRIRRGEEGFRALYTMNRDGTGVEYLTAAPGMISTGDPEWSHDGKAVAMNGLPRLDAMGESKIFVYGADGPFKGLIRDLGYGNTPSWSPDDRQIAYMINEGNPIQAKGGVWIVNSDSTSRRWRAPGMWPRWSPDGKLLCCQAPTPDGSYSLGLVDVASGATRPLLSARGWTLLSYGGNWSPDGQRVVFVGEFAGKHRLATIALSGADDSIRILYTNDDPEQQLFGPPAWSPDGRQIVFIIQQSGPAQRLWLKSYLYCISTDAGSVPVLLEGRQVGQINRGMAFSRDGAKVIFSSER